MKPIQSASGGVFGSARDYDIGTSTDIKAGAVVKLSGGLVVKAAVNETGAMLGVAAESHTGAADALNPRNNGEKIKVYDAPDTVFECAVPSAAATGGSATTVTFSTLGAFSNDDFNGGWLKLVSKAVSSSNTDPIGKLIRITDYAYNSTGTVSTFTKASGGTPSAGDMYEIYPPAGFAKGNYDTAVSGMVLTATAALPTKVIGCDTERGKLRIMPKLHALGTEE